MISKFLSALLCLTFYTLVPVADAAKKPNIVLIMCDDLGWGDTGFNGNKIIKTPHLDEMARAGLNMKRFYAGAPVCSPTRGSCLTGRNPFRYGIVNANAGHMKGQELTLAEMLKVAGYRTGHFGKWHLGTLTKTVRDSNRGGPKNFKHYSPPWQNGFEVCFSTEAKVPTWDPMLKPAGKAPNKGWAAIEEDSPSKPYGTFYWNEAGEIVKDNLRGDDSKIIMDRALPFINQTVKQTEPFFCVIWFHTPHLPVVAGPRYRKMYEKYNLFHSNYYGCITAMDEQVGRLRAHLKQLKTAENTMLWFCSDNGPEGTSGAPGSAGPFRGRKRDLLEGGIRVPALLEWPAKIRRGIETSFPMVTSDYLPTILEAAGLSAPTDRPVDGINLWPIIENNLKNRQQPIGFQYKKDAAWMTDRYKLLHTKKKPGFQLYDLLNDPGETNDLSQVNPAIVAQMKTQLERWMKSCEQSDQGRDY